MHATQYRMCYQLYSAGQLKNIQAVFNCSQQLLMTSTSESQQMWCQLMIKCCTIKPSTCAYSLVQTQIKKMNILSYQVLSSAAVVTAQTKMSSDGRCCHFFHCPYQRWQYLLLFTCTFSTPLFFNSTGHISTMNHRSTQQQLRIIMTLALFASKKAVMKSVENP